MGDGDQGRWGGDSLKGHGESFLLNEARKSETTNVRQTIRRSKKFGPREPEKRRMVAMNVNKTAPLVTSPTSNSSYPEGAQSSITKTHGAATRNREGTTNDVGKKDDGV